MLVAEHAFRSQRPNSRYCSPYMCLVRKHLQSLKTHWTILSPPSDDYDTDFTLSFAPRSRSIYYFVSTSDVGALPHTDSLARPIALCSMFLQSRYLFVERPKTFEKRDRERRTKRRNMIRRTDNARHYAHTHSRAHTHTIVANRFRERRSFDLV